MDLKTFRLSRQLSQAKLAEDLGLRSKSYICEIEKSGVVPQAIAVAIYRKHGALVGPLAALTAREAAILAKVAA